MLPFGLKAHPYIIAARIVNNPGHSRREEAIVR